MARRRGRFCHQTRRTGFSARISENRAHPAPQPRQPRSQSKLGRSGHTTIAGTRSVEQERKMTNLATDRWILVISISHLHQSAAISDKQLRVISRIVKEHLVEYVRPGSD